MCHIHMLVYTELLQTEGGLRSGMNRLTQYRDTGDWGHHYLLSQPVYQAMYCCLVRVCVCVLDVA